MKALIIIDIQNGLTNRKNLHQISHIIDTVNYAIKIFRETENVIVFMQHNNKQLINATDNWEIDSRIDKNKNDLVIQKFHGNAFDRTDLVSVLSENNVEEILVSGLVSHGCVKSMCIGGLALGLQVALLKNGHTNWDKNALDRIHSVELELMQKGIKVIEKQNVVNE
jgi:nicotinamidase-related amidase